ncbi:uncharacterized symporter YwcA, partial [Arthrobacter sp. Hiyo6]
MNPVVGIAAFAAVSVATAMIGFYGLRVSRTTGDFYVASRTVRPWWNASAIGGEYLSAASFLGVAGLILLSGTDALWFPIGYTAGYLMLLLFVAAPLRRSGAYTIPDFTEVRLNSKAVRRVTSLVVVVVGWLYIVPQLHGAALTIRITTGLPAWVGSVAVVVVVCLTVVAGGMRSITFVQAFQYWLKLTALAVPIVFIVLVLAGNGSPGRSGGLRQTPRGWLRPALPKHLAAGGAALRHPRTAARPGALLHESRRPLGAADNADRPRAIVRFLPFPHRLRAGRPDVRAGFGPERSVRRAGPPAPGPARRRNYRRPVVGPRGCRSIRRVPLHNLRPCGLAGRRYQSGRAGWERPRFPGGGADLRRRALGFAFMTDSMALAGSVGLVFAFTASTICPALLLGIWWRGLTDVGAIAGMLTGGILCGGSMVAGALSG